MATTIPSPYCVDTELLIEESVRTLPATINKNRYIEAASREMNAKLGTVYAIPLTLNSGYGLTDFPSHEEDLIKDIGIKLASGRMLVQIAADSDDDVNKYGWRLIEEAQWYLKALVEKQISISANPTAGAEASGADAPGIQNRDHESMVESFEDVFMRPPSQQLDPPLLPPVVYPGPE